MTVTVLVLAGLGVWFVSGSEPPPPEPAARTAAVEGSSPPPPTALRPAPPPPPMPVTSGPCSLPSVLSDAARANGASLTTLNWAPFSRPEQGWETYAPFIGREIASPCAPADPGFADALARWQAAHGRPATGILAPEDFEIMRVESHRRRPFVIAFAQGCPAAADPAALASARPDEGYAGKAVSLRPEVLDAYRAMVEAARREEPAIAADARMLTIFSAYRGPEDEAARCVGRDCTGLTRAACSAHRTGTALDMYLGEAPGLRPESTEDANRLHQSRTPAYRWLIANAGRFGFTPYIFEPWHWEWVGPATAPGG
jgi:D-alanyl-D-alanine carboxypeptidase